MDKKGIGLFLLVTLGAGWLIQGVLFYPDILTLRPLGVPGSFVLLALLYLPWLAAGLASRKSPVPASPTEAPKPMTWTVFTMAALLAPALFILVYMIIAFTGLVAPDWALGTLINALKPTMERLGQPLGDTTAALPTTILVIGMVLSVVLGATVYALIVLGGEKGWRAFLLPRLLPLGRVPAYVLVGLLWGLWFLPMLIDWYADFGAEGRRFAEARSLIIRFLLMAVFLSIILGEIWRRRRSAGLTAAVLGGFLGQMQVGGLSMWSYLFAQVEEPWTGSFGVVSLIIWGLAALVAILLPGRWGEAAAQPQPASSAHVPGPESSGTDVSRHRKNPEQGSRTKVRAKARPARKEGASQSPQERREEKSKTRLKSRARKRQ